MIVYIHYVIGMITVATMNDFSHCHKMIVIGLIINMESFYINI